MPKFDLDLENQSALQSVNQVTQAVKQLFQLLQKVKGALGDLGVGGSSSASFLGSSSTASGAATGSASSSGLNLAGAFGSAGSFNLGALLAAQDGINSPQSLNPSIQMAQNQSVMAGLGGNPANRDQGYTSPASRMFSSVMGDVGDYYDRRGGFAGTGNPSYGYARRQFEEGSAAAYQGFVSNEALSNVMDRWNYSGGGLQERGFGGDSFTRLGDLRQQGVDSRAGMISQGRMAIGSTLVYGAAQIANAYSQSVTSGQQNQMGYASAYGSIAGGVAGGLLAGGSAMAAGAAAGSIIPGFGTLVGAALGATLGGGLASAAIAPGMAKLETEKIGASTAAIQGMSALSFARGANEMSGQINESNVQRGAGFANAAGEIKDRFLRFAHLYTGDDVVSQQDSATVLAGNFSANLANGTYLSPGANRAQSQAFQQRYGVDAADIMQRMSPALSRARSAGNNMSDLVSSAGVDATMLLMRHMGDEPGAMRLAKSYGGTLDAAYGYEGQMSVVAGANSDYAASSLGGHSFSQRSGAFRARQGTLSDAVIDNDARISAEAALPDGNNSNKMKALKAVKSQLYAEIASGAESQAGGVLSDAFAAGGAGLSGAGIGLTRANLYGNAASFGTAGAGVMSALDSEAGVIGAAMNDPNLSYQDRMRGRTRLNEIASQKITLPAQIAGSQYRRNLLGADVGAAQAGYGSNYAAAYGSDGDVNAAAGRGIGAQQSIIETSVGALSNPNLSVEDRAQAQMRIAGAQSNQLQMQLGSRDTILSRISGRGSVAAGAAGYQLNRAAVLGTGNDLRAASGGLASAFGDEAKSLQAQLDAGGLSVEQTLRVKSQLNNLASQKFGTEQNAIDAGNAKDDLTGYTTPARKLQGQQDRLQYLPFSASNPIKLSLQTIQLNKKQLGVLDAREAAERSAGNLSPERADEIEGQRQSLFTQNAAAVSQISEGFINRLPSLSAGAPSFSGRFNSYNLAAAQLNLMGSPIRSFGASNGGSLRTQDDFIRAAGGSPDEIAARSTTTGLNSSGETNALLRRLVEAVERNQGGGGNGMRPGETAGNAYSQLARRDVSQSNPSASHN